MAQGLANKVAHPVSLLHLDHHDLLVGSRLYELLQFLHHGDHSVPVLLAMVLLPLQVIHVLCVAVMLFLQHFILCLHPLQLVLLTCNSQHELMRLHLVLDLRVLGRDELAQPLEIHVTFLDAFDVHTDEEVHRVAAQNFRAES